MTPTSTRADSRDQPWPLRPWLMAGLCSVAGFFFFLLVDHVDATQATAWAVVGASFIAVATLSFVMTVEPRRWLWSLAFALGWGLVVGLVSWTTYGYNRGGEVAEFPFLASIFAVLLACPLFQAARDEGAWRFGSGSVHNHVWTDAVIGAASIAFVGLTFLLAWLIAGLFDVIGADFLKRLLEKGAFGFSLAGLAFGGAVGILRERDALVATMQRLVMVVLAVLSPVLAVALALFLLSLPLSGLSGLWDSWASAAGLTLAAAGGSWVLLNAAIGLGDGDRPTNRVLHWAALILTLVVLPLAGLAMTALVLRVGQYGWTPDRMWAVICAGVALAYGLAGWWAVGRGRADYAPLIRTLQTRLALGVCGVALLLALPIVDFGAISARDQVARLRSGAIELKDFDWAAMAFDFGPEGRALVQRLAETGSQEQRAQAREALAAEQRWDLDEVAEEAVDPAEAPYLALPIEQKVRVYPAGQSLPVQLLARLNNDARCRRSPCVAVWLDQRRVAIIGRGNNRSEAADILVRQPSDGRWIGQYELAREAPPAVTIDMIENGEVSFREVRRRQIVINGQVVSGDLE